MTAVVERTVSGGRAVKVEITTDRGYPLAVATVDGAVSGDAFSAAIKLHKPLMSGGTMYTHYIGKVALTAAEAAKIAAALASAKATATDARLREARQVYPDAIVAKFGGECGMTDRSFFAGTPIAKTEAGWSIADQRTRDAELTGNGRRWDWLSRAMSHEDSIY